MAEPGLVDRYLTLGLRLGRHIDGLVDAYYGPRQHADRVQAEPVLPPDRLIAEARSLLADIDAGASLDGTEPSGPRASSTATDGAVPARRRWLRAQVLGLVTTASKLNGEAIGYADEVEA